MIYTTKSLNLSEQRRDLPRINRDRSRTAQRHFFPTVIRRRRALSRSANLVQVLTEGELRGQMNRPRRSYRQYGDRREGGKGQRLIFRANRVKN